MSLTDEIRAFLADDLGRRLDGVADDDSLLETGVIDSIGVMSLVAFLEKQYGFVVTDDDLMPENFDSVNAVARFVNGRRGTGSA